MSRQVNDQHKQSLFLDAIDNLILVPQPRGTVAFPLATERFVVKSPNQPESGGTGELDDVLPLLISLKNIFRRLPNPAENVTVLENLPRILNSIYN